MIYTNIRGFPKIIKVLWVVMYKLLYNKRYSKMTDYERIKAVFQELKLDVYNDDSFRIEFPYVDGFVYIWNFDKNGKFERMNIL